MPNYELIKLEDYPARTCRADDLEIGELGQVVDNAFGRKGIILLRMDGGLVSLDKPGDVWSGACGLEVRRLTPGTIIQLKVKADD